MPLADVLAWAVLLAVPLNVVVVVLLFQSSRQAPKIKVLRERMVAAACVLLNVLVFALIFRNNDTLPPPFDTGFTRIVTRFAELVIAYVPATLWLWLNRNGHDDS